MFGQWVIRSYRLRGLNIELRFTFRIISEILHHLRFISHCYITSDRPSTDDEVRCILGFVTAFPQSVNGHHFIVGLVSTNA